MELWWILHNRWVDIEHETMNVNYDDRPRRQCKWCLGLEFLHLCTIRYQWPKFWPWDVMGSRWNVCWQKVELVEFLICVSSRMTKTSETDRQEWWWRQRQRSHTRYLGRFWGLETHGNFRAEEFRCFLWFPSFHPGVRHHMEYWWNSDELPKKVIFLSWTWKERGKMTREPVSHPGQHLLQVPTMDMATTVRLYAAPVWPRLSWRKLPAKRYQKVSPVHVHLWGYLWYCSSMIFSSVHFFKILLPCVTINLTFLKPSIHRVNN